VRTIEVVVVEVFVEVALQGGRLRHERAGEGGPPALLQDRQLEALDAAVRVRPARLDEALVGLELLDGVSELARAELGAIVGRGLAQLPAGRLQLAGDAVEQLAGVARARVALGGAKLRPAEGGGDVDRGVLPDGALGPG
jgi:hypothetical protein